MRKIILCAFVSILLLAGCSSGTQQINTNEKTNTDGAQDSQETVDNQEVNDNQKMNIEQLQDCMVSALICYVSNPEEYTKAADCHITFGEIAETEAEGNKIVSIPVVMKMTGEYTEDCMDYSMAITPSFILGDEKTGVVFKMENGNGSGQFAYGGSIVSDQENISVSYECIYNSALGEWVDDGKGGFTKDIEFNVEYKVTVPSNYEGLVIRINPVNSYEDYMSEEESQYLWENSTEGTRFFKIMQQD